MFEKLPAIYVGADKTRVVTKIHDHGREAFGHNGVVKCDDEGCRAELILQGGVEMIRRKWYCALGEDISFTIAQAGMTNPDGSPYCHHHAPRGADYAIECDSPECNRFFAEDWGRDVINKRAGNPGRAIAAPTARERPKSIADLDQERAVFEKRARQAAATEIEAKRQIQAQLWPLPR